MRTNIVKEFPVFIPNLENYILAASIFNACQKQGQTVKSADCLIVSLAIENNLVLLHKDKDFEYLEANTKLQTFPV